MLYVSIPTKAAPDSAKSSAASFVRKVCPSKSGLCASDVTSPCESELPCPLKGCRGMLLLVLPVPDFVRGSPLLPGLPATQAEVLIDQSHLQNGEMDYPRRFLYLRSFPSCRC